MRKIICLIFAILLCTISVSATEFSAPDPPDTAKQYMPDTTTSFWQDLWFIVKKAITQFYPSIKSASTTCFCVLTVIVLVSLLNGQGGHTGKAIELAGTISVATMLLSPSNALIALGVKTVTEIAEYGKLLLPVMTASLAAEGGSITSVALYTGTLLFNSVLSSGIIKLLLPMLYAFIALSIAVASIDEQVLKNIHSFIKWLITWTLKITIYLFTGYLGITSVVSGTADAAAVKATKLAISGSIPVIGSIISDASEAILVSTGVIKNAAGSYGLLVILAIWIGPFLQISFQYILLKATAAIGGVFGNRQTAKLIESFGVTMGYLLAATGTVCLLLLISTVCFMKGVGN